MPETQIVHRLTIRVPEPIWNATKLAAIKTDQSYNDTIIQTLKERFGEIQDLSKIEVNAGA